jgi:N6-L-threonylcarbamoyladenine synthase
LALARSLPFIGVNHLEGHLLAAELEAPGIPRPFLGIVASGGHTSLYRVSEGPQYARLAGTRDDAMGEAFDKVAKLLGLGYPGGPAIQKAAESGDAKRFRLKAGTLKDGSLGFSYSGIKTAVRYLIEELRPLGPLPVADIAASFQRTVVEDLVHKSLEIAKAQKVKAVVLSGGVAANRVLRQTYSEACPAAGLAFFSPPLRWCTDNAAMIGLVGARKLLQGQRSDFSLPAIPNLSRSDEWMESTPLAGSVISPGI